MPGESHGQRSLVSYSPWGCKELDTTEQLTHTHTKTPSQGDRQTDRDRETEAERGRYRERSRHEIGTSETRLRVTGEVKAGEDS